mgnify:CR=1 FL=1
MSLSDPAHAAERLLTWQEAITLALQSIQSIAEIESVPLLSGYCQLEYYQPNR